MSNLLKVRLLLVLGLLIGGLLFALGQQAPPAKPPDQKASEDKKKPEVIYGNTPEDLKPFANYVKEPYKNFWVPSDSPVMFWGPGRDKPEPEVETVKIGVIAPVTRSYETYIGQSVLHGMEMALDDANATGGYKGKRFEAVVKNDTGLWGASANEVVSLSYDDKVWAIIGTVDGANTHIAIRVALRTEIPIMNVADTDATLVETKIPWVVRVIPDDRQMTYTIAYYVYKQLGLNSVAILRASNRYGRIGVTQFKKASIKLGKPAPDRDQLRAQLRKRKPELRNPIGASRKSTAGCGRSLGRRRTGRRPRETDPGAGDEIPYIRMRAYRASRFPQGGGKGGRGSRGRVSLRSGSQEPEVRRVQEALRGTVSRGAGLLRGPLV